LDGVGAKTDELFAELGIQSIDDLLRYKDELPKRLARVVERNQSFLVGCTYSARVTGQ
jgi:hypothetical protein